LPRISGIGPGSTRIIREVLDTGESPTVERAIDASDTRADIDRRRALRRHFLSRAEMQRVLSDPGFAGPTQQQYRGDVQMHSEWSDGAPSVQQIADACLARGYQYAAVSDHSHGLKIAGGMSMAEAAEQRLAIARVNARLGGQFRLLQGIEANIGLAGQLDLTDEEAATFEIVLAAPHSRLRKADDQTARMLAAIQHPSVRILAHPRGRITGSRPGVSDVLARRAFEAGYVIALDSDAHTIGQLAYAETALAHARLAAIPPDRLINCVALTVCRAIACADPLASLGSCAVLKDPGASALCRVRAANAAVRHASCSAHSSP